MTLRSRLRHWRALALVAALAMTTVGLVGTWRYAQAYSNNRGFTPIARLPRTRGGRLVTVRFFSRSLHQRTDYLVYLPPGYSRARRYATYYLLHGAPGAPNVFLSVAGLDVRLINRVSQRRVRPMILVFPDGRIHGDTFSDSEWANTYAGAYESYVIDVVRDVDRRFSALRSRNARVIAGYSAGAYGALNIALHHLATFANVQSWSGYFTQTRSGVFAHATRAMLAYNSPLDEAALLRRSIAAYPLRVYMFIGRADPAAPQIAPTARALARSGARVSYNLYPGGHDWQVWYSRVDPMLVMASEMVSHPLPSPRLVPGTPAPSPPGPAAGLPIRRVAATDGTQRAVPKPRRSTRLWWGLALALISAVLINLGFLLQHRGLARVTGSPWSVLRSRAWLGGQAVGWIGFSAQIIAVGLAPLSIVQAFAAGGLALCVPLAIVLFDQPMTGARVSAVAAVAAALAVLSLGLPHYTPHAAHQLPTLMVLASLAAAVAAAGGTGPGRALAAGMLYGMADAAIKAIAVGVHGDGVGALLSWWTAVVAGATFAGFLLFQAALRRSEAVTAISLMTAMTTLAAVGFGVLAFGESLGVSTAVTVVHLLAIAVVLGCVPVLATAQRQPAEEPAPDNVTMARRPVSWPTRALPEAARAGAAVLALLTACLVGLGLLYVLRGLGWFSDGPKVSDALPLLQLARADGQPLGRVVIAWLLAGMGLSVALAVKMSPRRAAVMAVLTLILLLFASEASFALARNDGLGETLRTRAPGLGPWVEAAVLVAALALPTALGSARARHTFALRSPASARSG